MKSARVLSNIQIRMAATPLTREPECLGDGSQLETGGPRLQHIRYSESASCTSVLVQPYYVILCDNDSMLILFYS